jgi:hypothetical protein
MANNKLWVRVDYALRTRFASHLFFILLRREIRHYRNAIKAVRPSTAVRPRLVPAVNETRRRISLGEGLVPVSIMRNSFSQRDTDADQFLIDAILEGGDGLESFLTRQELNPSKPRWTPDYSKERVAVIRTLLHADAEDFVIWVMPTDDGHFCIIDCNHRFRLAQIRRLRVMKVIFFLPIPSIDWSKPRSFFLDRLIGVRKYSRV